MSKDIKEPPFRMENGRKIYSIPCTINASRRPKPAATVKVPESNQAAEAVADPEQGASGDPQSQGAPDPGGGVSVSVRFRLLSAVDA